MAVSVAEVVQGLLSRHGSRVGDITRQVGGTLLVPLMNPRRGRIAGPDEGGGRGGFLSA